jgi:predicted transcriptional regulator
MENFNPEEISKSLTKVRGIKTSDVKRMKREGKSVHEISEKLGVSQQSVRYHLAKKRADAGIKRVINPIPVDNSKSFEAELFGTLIKLDQVPSSIERVGNRIVIK